MRAPGSQLAGITGSLGSPRRGWGLSGSYSSDPLSCLELLLSPRALSTTGGQVKAGVELDDLEGRPLGGSFLRCSFPDITHFSGTRWFRGWNTAPSGWARVATVALRQAGGWRGLHISLIMFLSPAQGPPLCPAAPGVPGQSFPLHWGDGGWAGHLGVRLLLMETLN